MARLLIEKLLPSFPIWGCLHGLWRTLPSFNPQAVSSEPGQDLENEALGVLFGGDCDRNPNVGSERLGAAGCDEDDADWDWDNDQTATTQFGPSPNNDALQCGDDEVDASASKVRRLILYSV